MKTLNISSFSRLILVSSLSILPIGISSTAYAGTTDTHQVNVTVNGVLEIETLSASTNHTFNTASTGTVPITLSNARIRSNQKNGFKVQITSANDGLLQEGSDTDFQLPYTLSSSITSGLGTTQTNVNLASITGAADFYTSDTFKNQNCASSSGCEIGVTLNYNSTDAANLPGATYTDIITFTVSAQ